MYAEEDFLLLSGIQHFSFCRRQWALIHIEQAWAENERTVSGGLMHRRVHDKFFDEKRGDRLFIREMPVISRDMGVSGQCDMVEFRRDDAGAALFGREGKWLPVPVEYKRGSPKMSDADRLQLTAQAMCLEEMLCCPVIETAYLFYGETKRREAVALTDELREKVKNTFAEMHEYAARGHTPRVKPFKSCNACSLKEICVPKLPNAGVEDYLNRLLEADV
jgi:CRISPR-associated exonuclease Cas4